MVTDDRQPRSNRQAVRGWLRSLVVVWTLVGGGLVAWGLWRLLRAPLGLIAPPLLFAGVIVYILNPIVDRVQRMGVHRVVATMVTYVVTVATLVGLGTLLVPLLSRQLGELVAGLPQIANGVRDGATTALSRFGLEELVPDGNNSQELGQWLASIVQDNGDSVVGVLGTLRHLLGSVLSGVLGLVLAPVLSFYLLSDLPRVTAGVQRLLPPDVRDEVTDVTRRILQTVGAYFRGQLLVAAFVGAATAAGMAVVGLPFWAIIGAMAGVFNLIPFVGPTTGALAGMTVALTVGGGVTQAVAVLIVMVVVQQLDNHVITPNVLSRTVHVHPVTIILSLVIAGTQFGLLGMLVAIPTVATIKLVALYVLATRVDAMSHLTDPDQFLDGVAMAPARPGSLVGLSQQLRASWLKRRAASGGDAA